MIMKPFSKEAYWLFHEGALALADMEATGVRADVSYLKEQEKIITENIKQLDESLWEMKEGKDWKKHFGAKASLDSPQQLADMLFKVWKHTPSKYTAKDNTSSDDEVLRKIGTPFLKGVLTRRKSLKVRDTYFAGLLRYEVDGIIHPSYNLNLVISYRSSSDSPNFQNIPVRDPVNGPLVRRSIIPHRPEDMIMEMDFSGIEVRVAACYHKDPTMLSYINDPSKDMHRDMAAECFMLKLKQVGKKIRYCGKNGFVFPAFYGSYYATIAPALWEMVDEHKLITEDGISVRRHLCNVGLTSLPLFVCHIQDVEKDFWGRRFRKFDQWKKDWYKSYLKTGYFDTLTGFRCQGSMRKNEAVNYPIQGSAFHCTLWTMTKIHQWLRENNMKSALIGQIHDSIIANVVPEEKEIVMKTAYRIACKDVREHYKWIITPFDVEIEITEPGKSWADKKKVEVS